MGVFGHFVLFELLGLLKGVDVLDGFVVFVDRFRQEVPTFYFRNEFYFHFSFILFLSLVFCL
jgi:hypothetical protein